MHHLRGARQGLASFTVNGCLYSTKTSRDSSSYSVWHYPVSFLSELFLLLFLLSWGEASNIEVILVRPKGRDAKWTMPFMRYELLKVCDLDSIITSF